MMQHLLCVSSQIPLGYWEKPVEKMEEEILRLGAGICFFTSVWLLMETVSFPFDSDFLNQVLCISISIVCVKTAPVK